MDSFSNPNSISKSNPTTTEAPSFSPASLLWAHQLRREHNTLVSRLDALDGALSCSSAEVDTRVGNLRVELDKKEKEINNTVSIVKSEIEGIKGDVEGLKGWRGVVEEKYREWKEKGEEVMRREREGREMRAEFERSLNEVWDGVRKLKGVVEELRREREEQIERDREVERHKEREGEGEKHTLPVAGPYTNQNLSDNDPFRSSSLPPIPRLHSQQHQQQHKIPSTISGTPTVTHLPSSHVTRSSLPPQTPHDDSSILAPHSIPPAPSPSSHADHAESTGIFPTSPPQPNFSRIVRPSGGMEYDYPEGVQNMRQGHSESLESYFARGETVSSAFPRREENRAVLAFWEGLGNAIIKNRLEDELEKEGWRWEVVKGFMMGGSGPRGGGLEEEADKYNFVSENMISGCGNVTAIGNRAAEKKKKKKKKSKAKTRKRRAIPVIWPVDEDGEGWLVVQNGLT